jgi:hypothetical protein
MQPTATIANALWTASNLPAWRRFRRALVEPSAAQRRKLQELIERNADTAFGKMHRFSAIRTYEEFARRVPLSDYAGFEPWIERIRQGEKNLLTHDAVTHLVPTSGSTGGRKLIPFTAGLQREFNAAIGPWLVDLVRQSPGLLGGPSYWSITPVMENATPQSSVVPIGFETDTAYLGGGSRKFAEAVMAVPSSVAHSKSLDEFRYQTLLHLLVCREMRLISVWHPSFLALLLDVLPGFWKRLLKDIERGSPSIPARPRRAEELATADPLKPETLWPELRVISCWGDGAASLAVRDLQGRFPRTHFQHKGLIATEAFVTLPFREHHPLAVCSHFFEFIDPNGRVLTADSVRDDTEYEVVVTTGGGLWRYRLGDRVKVNGWVKRTPSLKFLGRGGNVSDKFGEKLSEEFVAESLVEVFGGDTPRFALLAPDEDASGCRYTLYFEAEARPHWAANLDRALCRNPHYAYCRSLGQLLPARVFLVPYRGFETFAQHEAPSGARLGDLKPVALSRKSGWSRIFSGKYVDDSTNFHEGCRVSTSVPCGPTRPGANNPAGPRFG